MLKIIEQNTHSPLTLIFSGDVSVTEIGKLRTRLLGLPTDKPEYLFRIEKIENLDLSFFQLLIAVAIKMNSLKKKFTFKFDLDEEYQRIMEESGCNTVFKELQSI